MSNADAKLNLQQRAEAELLMENLLADEDALRKFVYQAIALRDSPPPYVQPRPSEPPKGLLVSIALRLDHGLLLPGFAETEEEHKRRIECALSDARRAWEECTGNGFWSPERNAGYEASLTVNAPPHDILGS